MFLRSLDLAAPPTQLLLVLMGVGFASVSGWAVYKNERLLRRGKRVRGVIARLDWRVDWGFWCDDQNSAGNGGAYFPVFSFIALDGSRHVVSSKSGTSPSPFSIGQEVQILYDPESPSTTATIDTFWQMWTGAILFGAFGLGLLLYTLVHWLKHA